MSTFDELARNSREANRQLADLRRGVGREREADQIFEHPRRLIIRGDDGDFYALTVVSGALDVVSLGSELP